MLRRDRRIRLMTLGAAGALGLLAAVVMAQAHDGRWSGTITCAKLTFTARGLKTPTEMTVSDGTVTYSRTVYSEDGTRIVGVETGSGTVSADGAITISATWNSPAPRYTYTATYAGTMSAGSADLHGTQVWRYDGKSENRACSITLKRTPGGS